MNSFPIKQLQVGRILPIIILKIVMTIDEAQEQVVLFILLIYTEFHQQNAKTISPQFTPNYVPLYPTKQTILKSKLPPILIIIPWISSRKNEAYRHYPILDKVETRFGRKPQTQNCMN